MRIVIVGSAQARARLRQALAGARVEIVGEAAAIEDARPFEADALLVAPADRATGSRDRDPVEHLSPREIEVLELVAEGLPNKAIAARLGISDQTAKFHVASICGKLGVANRTEAVRVAIRRGLIAV